MIKKALTITTLTALAIIAGFLWFTQNQKTAEVMQEKKEENTKSLDTTINDTSAQDIDTSDWKTYTNDEHGFKFKYPEGWEFDKINSIELGVRFELSPSLQQEVFGKETDDYTSFYIQVSQRMLKNANNPVSYFQNYFKSFDTYQKNINPDIEKNNLYYTGNTTMTFNGINYWIVNEISRIGIQSFFDNKECIKNNTSFPSGVSLNILEGGHNNQSIGFSCSNNMNKKTGRQLWEIINSFQLVSRF